MLTITLGLPASLKGNTTGLTGVYDDIKSNDFTWPNGTGYISVNSSESDVFDWASLCKFNAPGHQLSLMAQIARSLFQYAS